MRGRRQRGWVRRRFRRTRNEESIAAAAEVFEKFNKIAGRERMDELIAAAAAEEGKLTVYSTLTPVRGTSPTSKAPSVTL